MGMFLYEIVLRDIPFKKGVVLKRRLKFQRDQWPRRSRLGGVNDPAEIWVLWIFFGEY
jgi:hypothetical protein